MHIENLSHWSGHLNREMYLNRYGHAGIPVVVFASSANWLHQEAFNRFIERKKLSPDQRIFIYVGTEEADDTDKTLMAGNIKQAYIDSSLRYYHDLIAGGVHLDNLVLKVQSGAIHSEIPWSENLPDCLRFLAEKW